MSIPFISIKWTNLVLAIFLSFNSAHALGPGDDDHSGSIPGKIYFEIFQNLSKHDRLQFSSVSKSKRQKFFHELRSRKVTQGLADGLKLPLLFSPDSTYCVFADDSGCLTFWDFIDDRVFQKCSANINPQRKYFSAQTIKIQFSPDGRELAQFSSQGQISFWRPKRVGDRLVVDLGQTVVADYLPNRSVDFRNSITGVQFISDEKKVALHWGISSKKKQILKAYRIPTGDRESVKELNLQELQDLLPEKYSPLEDYRIWISEDFSKARYSRDNRLIKVQLKFHEDYSVSSSLEDPIHRWPGRNIRAVHGSPSGRYYLNRIENPIERHYTYKTIIYDEFLDQEVLDAEDWPGIGYEFSLKASSALFSENGLRVAARSHIYSKIAIWNLDQKKLERIIRIGIHTQLLAFMISPDAKKLAIFSAPYRDPNKFSLTLFDLDHR